MTLNELRKTKEELNIERNKLLKKSENEIKEAIRYEKSQFNTTIIFRVIFSMLSYTIMSTIALLLTMGNITLNIPKLLVLPVFIIPSLIIGTCIDKALTKGKEKNTYELSNMNDDEKTEAEMRHKIKSAKSYSKAEVIKKAMAKIEEKERFIEANEDFYTSKPSNVSKEQVKWKIGTLTNTLNNNFKELDILSTKNFLAREFNDVRLKGLDKQKIFTTSICGGFLMTIFLYTPVILLASTPSLLEFFVVYGISTVSFGGYCNHRINIRNRVFNQLNSELEENMVVPVSEEPSKEIYEISTKKEKLINDTSFILDALKEQENLLSTIEENEFETDDVKQNEYSIDSNAKTIEEEPSVFDIVSAGLKKLPDNLLSTDRSGEAIKEGPTLVKKHK